jgi:hypothetical protein
LSYGSQLDAGYALGFDASKCGSELASGWGATNDHWTKTRTTRAPRARTSGIDVRGDFKNDPSWMIDSWSVDADAGAAGSATATASRAASKMDPVVSLIRSDDM